MSYNCAYECSMFIYSEDNKNMNNKKIGLKQPTLNTDQFTFSLDSG